MKAYITVVCLVASLAALLGWRAARNPEGGDQSHFAPPNLRLQSKGVGLENVKSKPIKAKLGAQVQASGFTQLQGLEGHEKWPLGRLLAGFELTGDMQYLRAAAANHQKDPTYLTLVALAATAPNAEALKRLEAAEPDNALPNLLRAGMYATTKNWKALKEELELAATKSTISTHTQERRAAMLDLLIESPNMPVERAVMPKTEQFFFQQLGAITQALNEQKALFGDTSATASAGIGLALGLRSMESGEHDLLSANYANYVEATLLSNVDPSAEYGETGLSVSQRIAQLKAEADEAQRLTQLYDRAANAGLDDLTRRRFYARMRADGEVAALEWLGRTLGTK